MIGSKNSVKQMAVVSVRSVSALGVPPYKSSGPPEGYDQNSRSYDPQLGTLSGYPNPGPIRSKLRWRKSSKEVLPKNLSNRSLSCFFIDPHHV